MGKLRKKRGTKYVGSQIWDSQMPEFFSPICAHSPSESGDFSVNTTVHTASRTVVLQ